MQINTDRKNIFFGNKIVGWVLALCFILIIATVPIIQLVKEIGSDEPLQEFDLFRQTPSVVNLRAYESKLEDNSIAAKAIRPRYQWLTTHLAKQGNAKVILGEDGWLFYRPAVDYIVSPESNFHRELGPMPAIIAFNEALKAQGVHLIMLPIPGKATIYPEYLSDRYNTDSGLPVNPYAPEFFRLLREKGVQVLDPSTILRRKKANRDNLYISQDTHWSPQGMRLVAKALAEAIEAGGWLAGVERRSYGTLSVEISRFGDLYDMLELPTGRSSFKPLSITVEKVVDMETGEFCVSDASSPVTLLGDSFVNVFSKGDMGWGENSGLGEHLALQLGLPVDIIAINDGGPTTSRESLVRRQNALVGKKLVIWQFPTRDLINPESDWKIVNVPEPQIDTQVAGTERDAPELIVTAEITKTSLVPDPTRVAYSECVTYIKYRVISIEQGEYADSELLAVFWGMRDSKLMPAARFPIGEKHRLSLDLFEDHQALSHIMQADDTDDYEHTPFWVLEMLPL